MFKTGKQEMSVCVLFRGVGEKGTTRRTEPEMVIHGASGEQNWMWADFHVI